jgi:hypothetical protein
VLSCHFDYSIALERKRKRPYVFSEGKIERGERKREERDLANAFYTRIYIQRERRERARERDVDKRQRARDSYRTSFCITMYKERERERERET